MSAILKRFHKCILCLCVPPKYTVLIRGMLIIVWPHCCPSSPGEEAETGEGCWEVCQHPAVSHLSCHPCYGSHGIPSVASKTQSWRLTAKPHILPPLLIGFDLNTMWINKRVSLDNFTLLTFIQIIGTNMKRRRGDAEGEILDAEANLHSIVYTGLCSVIVCKCISIVHWHAFFAYQHFPGRFLPLHILTSLWICEGRLIL